MGVRREDDGAKGQGLGVNGWRGLRGVGAQAVAEIVAAETATFIQGILREGAGSVAKTLGAGRAATSGADNTAEFSRVMMRVLAVQRACTSSWRSSNSNAPAPSEPGGLVGQDAKCW